MAGVCQRSGEARLVPRRAPLAGGSTPSWVHTLFVPLCARWLCFLCAWCALARRLLCLQVVPQAATDVHSHMQGTFLRGTFSRSLAEGAASLWHGRSATKAKRAAAAGRPAGMSQLS